MGQIITGNLAGAEIELDTDVGILKMAEKQGVLFRVKLINRLFGAIISRPFFWLLLKQAGETMGEDYALDWILTNLKDELPRELQKLGSRFKEIEGLVEADSMNPERLTNERMAEMERYAQHLTTMEAEVKQLIQVWLQAKSDESIYSIWQQMHDEDVIAGWGRSRLVKFDRLEARAEIQVTSSFIARLYYYWIQQGKSNERICSFLEGYFLGEAKLLLSRYDLVSTESICRMMGAENCVFVIEPEKLWTQKADLIQHLE